MPLKVCSRRPVPNSITRPSPNRSWKRGSGRRKGAIEEANRADATPVALMNGEQLVKLLVENDIGIRRTPADLIELGDGEDEV